ALFARSFATDCGVVHRPGYLFTEKSAKLAELRDELDAARRAGLTADFVPDAPLPFETKGAIRVPNQMQLHVGRYLEGMARAASANGALIHETTRVIAIEDGDTCLV